MKDYYYILGIDENASIEEVKKAYRKLSLKFHPDKNEGDKFFEERFKEINEAYETLVDPEKKRIYDFSRNSSSEYSGSDKQEEYKGSKNTNTSNSYNKNNPEETYADESKDRTDNFDGSLSNDEYRREKNLKTILFIIGGLLLLIVIFYLSSVNFKSGINSTNTYNHLTADSNDVNPTQNDINYKNIIVDSTKMDTASILNNSEKIGNNYTKIRDGEHDFWLENDKFGDQPPGTVTIKNVGIDRYTVYGKQISTNNIDYVNINGIITVISDKYFNFEGELKYMINDLSPNTECIHKEIQLFKSRKEKWRKKYWRLERIENCDGNRTQTTSDIDIEF